MKKEASGLDSPSCSWLDTCHRVRGALRLSLLEKEVPVPSFRVALEGALPTEEVERCLLGLSDTVSRIRSALPECWEAMRPSQGHTVREEPRRLSPGLHRCLWVLPHAQLPTSDRILLSFTS